MKFLLYSVMIFILSCSTLQTESIQSKADLSYKLEMMLEPFPMLKVEMSFRGDKDGITKIDLPDQWASQKHYYNGLKNIQLLTVGAQLEPTKSRNIYQIKHQPAEYLTLSYYVIQDFTESINHSNYYRPIIQDSYFHIIGHGLFIQPDWEEDNIYTLDFSWKLPKNWSIANSHSAENFHHQNRIQLGNLRHAVYLGGDFEIKKLTIANQPLFIASRSQWQFELEEYYQLVEKVVNMERGFFNDFQYPYYLITMIPTSEPCCSSGGTGLTNSFSTFISKDLPNIDKFKHLISHELFHNWNGRVIDRADPEELYYWFSEGFTDYFTRLLNLRNGIIDLPEYFEDFNRIYRNYYLSPARNKTNQDVKQQFWSNRDIGKIPYLRGDLLAHYWNQKIKTTGQNSIDSIIKDLYQSARKNGTVISNNTLQQHFLPYLKDGIAMDINKYIEAGNSIELPEDSLGSCGSLTEVESYPFDLGFDFQNSQQNQTVAGLKKHSNAYKAGLRNGHKMAGWSIYNGNTEVKSSITIILEDGSRKEIAYLPLGEKVMIPQFKLDLEMWQKDPQQCMLWFN